MAAIVGRALTVLACATATRALSLHDFSAKAIGGDDISFSKYKGKPALVLNVAAI